MADVLGFEWTGTANASTSLQRVNGVVTRTNRVLNPAFAKDITNWSVSNGTWDSAAQRVNGKATVAMTAGGTLGTTATVATPGEARRFGMLFINTGSVTIPVSLQIQYRNSSGAVIQYNDTTPQYTVAPGASQWLTNATPSAGYPALTVQAGVGARIGVAGVPVGATWQLDNVIDTEFGDGSALSPSDYFDGSSTVGTIYTWTGTANASTSVQRINGATRINYIPNPSFEGGVSGWGNAAGGGGSIAPSSSSALYGSATATVTTGTVDGSGAQANLSGVPTGADYTASAYVLAPVGASYKIRLSNNLNLALSTPAIGTGAWQRVSVTMPAASTTAGPSVQIVANGAGAGATLLVDGVMLEVASTPGPYFDGSFPWDIQRYQVASGPSTSTLASRPELVTQGTASGTSTSSADLHAQFLQIVSTLGLSDSEGWGSVPAVLSVDYDQVGPFRVGDSPLTAWAIEVDSDVNLYGTFDSGEVSILDPAGHVVAVQPSPFIDGDTIIVTVPVGTFTVPGVYTLVPRLVGRGSVTLPSAPIVVQADDGWQSLESARANWSEAPESDADLYRLLDVARIQCEEFAPAFIGRAPANFRQAQLLQARALWNSGHVKQDDQFGGGQMTVTVFPMDWTVKALLRPKRAVGAMF